jgi:hypothetical protein
LDLVLQQCKQLERDVDRAIKEQKRPAPSLFEEKE